MKNIKLEKFELTNQQTVSLVKGYLYDYPLPDGISTDWYKFEIIQHTYYTNKITQTSFDYDLSIEIIRGIINFFPSCTYTIEMDSDVKINSLKEYCHYIFNQKKIDKNPIEDAKLDWPKRFLIWNAEGKLVLHGRLQAWTIWGGEYPYNDAFSYEFYFEKNNTIALQNYYIDIFMKKQIFIHEILCGYLHKKQLKGHRNFQRFWAWLIRKKKDVLIKLSPGT